LRWELYPVPHEPAERSSHGGSYFEESEWWNHTRAKNRLGAVRAMVEEITTLRTVRLANRDLWCRSQVFHLGIYCSVLAILILSASALLGVAALHLGAVAWFGRVGLVLMIAGSCALLWKRMRDPDLLNSTHSADFVQLGAIALSAALTLTGSMSASVPSATVLVQALATGGHIQVPFALALGILIAFALLAYIPYSQMAHFIGKYFAYHHVRWDDKPLRGSNLEKRFAKNFELSPTWSAPHILGDGKRTWAEVALANPASIPGERK